LLGALKYTLLSEVLDGDVSPIESSESFLEVSVNATEPGAVLVEVYFWGTAAKDGKKSLEHALSIGDCRYSPLLKPTTLLERGATL
jgi:hypothetical protein